MQRPALVNLIASATLSISIAKQIAEGEHDITLAGLEELTESMERLARMIIDFTNTL
jgi:hypothetical protein